MDRITEEHGVNNSMAVIRYVYWQENKVGYRDLDEVGDPEDEPSVIVDSVWLGYLVRDPIYWRWSDTLDGLIDKLRDLDQHIDQAGGDVDAARTLAHYARGRYVRLGDQVPPEARGVGEFETAD